MLVLGNKPLPQPTMTNQTNGVPDSILSGFFFFLLILINLQASKLAVKIHISWTELQTAEPPVKFKNNQNSNRKYKSRCSETLQDFKISYLTLKRSQIMPQWVKLAQAASKFTTVCLPMNDKQHSLKCHWKPPSKQADFRQTLRLHCRITQTQFNTNNCWNPTLCPPAIRPHVDVFVEAWSVAPSGFSGAPPCASPGTENIGL